MNMFISNLFGNLPSVFPPPEVALTASLVWEALEYMDMGFTLLPPSVLEDMSKQEDLLQLLKKIPYVGFGGGMPLTIRSKLSGPRAHRKNRSPR